jgi:hypothetical protein
MEGARWRQPGDPELYRAIRNLWSIGMRTSPRRFPAGVFKHTSIEQLSAATEAWDLANFRAFYSARSRRP